MTKSDYISNSAKLLLISSVLLFATNALSLLGTVNPSFSSPAADFSGFCFFAVFALTFLAFNGEGIAYKHSRETVNKKKTTYLKILLFLVLLARYIKIPIENFALSFDDGGIIGICLRLFLSMFNSLASYGFLFTVVALWCVFRDRTVKKLLPFEVCALFLGVFYNVYKTFNYAVTKYELNAFGEFFVSAFSNRSLLNSLCLLQFLSDILMFAFLLRSYNEQAITEQEEKEKVKKKAVTARKIYRTDCFGLDYLEDDFFLEKNEAEEAV